MIELSLDDPEAFYVPLELRLKDARITSQYGRLSKLLDVFFHDLLLIASDIFIDTPSSDQYDVLKQALLCHIAASEEKRTHNLLPGIQLGRMMPSQLLRQMRALVGKMRAEDFYM